MDRSIFYYIGIGVVVTLILLALILLVFAQTSVTSG